ncbi:MAG: type I DNA topoisomerase [Pseudomonadota bacterium]|nr:type I DNA topoisomerase [Pseudomonadota bacterium]
MNNIVVVESPAKAKTINRYLGDGFKVLASYGHIRDLPSKNGSVRPDADFAMDWEIDSKAKKYVSDIASAVKGADYLYLATDPDREGEAISWHVQEVLDQQKLLDGVKVKRVVFNEITKNAILKAFENPRELDRELVDAYLARRALDYLVGFTLSPVLWRKLPGSRSAGRVQSVALRLVCERETEIENFKPLEYWSVRARFKTAAGEFWGNLTHLDGIKLARTSIGDKDAAKEAETKIRAADFSVSTIEKKQARRHPAAPFTTSTLQQEAARKLFFSAKRTMQVAQKLYEGMTINGETVGLITYMRTDGVQISNDAIGTARTFIGETFGSEYVPASARIYKSKAKNAQEAHEAIRPTDIGRRPEDLTSLEPDQLKLYELIWKRTVASQMESAVLDQVSVNLRPTGAAQTDDILTLRATGSVLAFDGFLKLYTESTDDDEDEEGNRRLPNVTEGMALEQTKVKVEQHFTQPPPRFSEASLVKRLEELGIGRPSTYASILSVLQERNYVVLEKRRFVPEDRGRLVTAFLSGFFERYVEYDFTAELEEKLDKISDGRIPWKTVLRDFWTAFSSAVDETSGLRIREVLDNLNEFLGPHFFPDTGNGDPRACPTCTDGELSLKLGRYGAFIGCSRYPECRYTRPLVVPDGEQKTIAADSGPVELGTDPDSGLVVTLRRGPYGYYVQLGELEGKTKPKRASITEDIDPETIDLKVALGLLSLPRDVGPHPETGEMIQAGIGRFGPYIKLEGTYVSLKDESVLEIGLNRAVTLLADAPRKPAPKEIGVHPKDGKPITIRQGRWGPFVQHGRTRAAIPKDTNSNDLTLEAAAELISAKVGQKAKAPGKKKAGSKASGNTRAKAKAPAGNTDDN